MKGLHIISIPLTPEEFAAIDQTARTQGLSPAEFMLQRATEAPPPTLTMADYLTLREAEDATVSPNRPPAVVAAAQAVRMSLEQGLSPLREFLDDFRRRVNRECPHPDHPEKMEPCTYFYGPVPLPYWHPHSGRVVVPPRLAAPVSPAK